jgi:hypothetical protein
LKTLSKSPLLALTILSLVLLVPAAPAVNSSASAASKQLIFYPNVGLGISPNSYSGSVNAPTKYMSQNWAGYADNAGVNTVTSVVASWIQPAVTCRPKASADQDAAMWVGIDGFSSFTVEQTGTSGFCPKGSSIPQYQAWVEFYPLPQSTYLTFVIHAGDVIKASVTYTVATHTFTAVLTDVTTGTSRSRSATSTTDSRSSAECIAEAPSEVNSGVVTLLPLARFTKAVFGVDNTKVAGTCFATINGNNKAMGAFGAEVSEITMVQNNPPTFTHKATPSGFTHSDSFTVTWNKAGP